MFVHVEIGYTNGILMSIATKHCTCVLSTYEDLSIIDASRERAKKCKCK